MLKSKRYKITKEFILLYKQIKLDSKNLQTPYSQDIRANRDSQT